MEELIKQADEAALVKPQKFMFIRQFFNPDKEFGRHRVIINIFEALFSLTVLVTAAVWVNIIHDMSTVNFALFVGLSSFLLCCFIAAGQALKTEDAGIATIQFFLISLYWLFWVCAAATSTVAVADVSSNPAFDFNEVAWQNCAVYAPQGFEANCEASGRKWALRTCCAFCWLTWAAWTLSTFMVVVEDVRRNKILTKLKASVASAPPPPPAKTLSKSRSGTIIKTPPRSRPGSATSSATASRQGSAKLSVDCRVTSDATSARQSSGKLPRGESGRVRTSRTPSPTKPPSGRPPVATPPRPGTAAVPIDALPDV